MVYKVQNNLRNFLIILIGSSLVLFILIFALGVFPNNPRLNLPAQVILASATSTLPNSFNEYNIVYYTKGNLSNLPLIPQSGSRPAKNGCYFDQSYNLNVCRTTDSSLDITGETSGIRPIYSRWQIDNSDGKYYLVISSGDHGHLIYSRIDNSLRKRITEFTNREGNELRWDYSGQYPNRLYYVSGCTFNQYDFVSGQTQLIRDFSLDFPGCGRILNDVEGDSSADSRYWTWMMQWAYDGQNYNLGTIFTYDKQENKILGKLDQAKYLELGGKYPYLDKFGNKSFPKPNMVDMSPSGKKIVALFGRSWGTSASVTNWTASSSGIYWTSLSTNGNSLASVKENETDYDYTGGSSWDSSTISSYLTKPGTYFFDRSLERLYILPLSENILTSGVTWGYGSRPLDAAGYFDGPHAFNKDFSSPVKVCIDETHSGWAYDSEGNEVYVCQDNRTDYLTATDIQTGAKINLIYHGDFGWGSGMHFSRGSLASKGWILISTYTDPSMRLDKWGSDQLFLLEIKDVSDHPRIWRLASTHNYYEPGLYEREAFAPISSDGKTIWWSGVWPNSNNLVETYKIDLPDNWAAILAGEFVPESPIDLEPPELWLDSIVSQIKNIFTQPLFTFAY